MVPGKMFAIVSAVFLVMAAGRVSGVCDDISSEACQQMYEKEPLICKDLAVAQSVCPKFCGLCPLKCYECDHAVRNYTDCQIEKDCAVGESCLLATMLAPDGHMEYKMNCANEQHCVGQGFLELLGRRNMHARSLTMKCCSKDLCNTPSVMYPTSTVPPPTTTLALTTAVPTTSVPTTTSAPTTTFAPTTTTPLPTTVPSTTAQIQQMTTMGSKCQRDIEVLIESTTKHTPDQINDLKHFLSGVVNGLDISAAGSAMGTAIFSHDVDNQHTLSTNKLAVFQDVNTLSLQTHHGSVELDDVVQYLVRRSSGDLPGGRPDKDNVVVFIFDHYSHADDGAHAADLRVLDDFSHDVIVINIGRSHTMFSKLATDPQHELTVPDYASLSTIQGVLINMICS